MQCIDDALGRRAIAHSFDRILESGYSSTPFITSRSTDDALQTSFEGPQGRLERVTFGTECPRGQPLSVPGAMLSRARLVSFTCATSSDLPDEKEYRVPCPQICQRRGGLGHNLVRHRADPPILGAPTRTVSIVPCATIR